MCTENESRTIAKKGSVLTPEEKTVGPATIMGPVVDGKVRVYGNPSIVPGGAAWLRFQAVYSKNGKQVL